jgi:hypothetical protein
MGDFLETPVFAHFSVKKILIDRRQFGGKNVV